MAEQEATFKPKRRQSDAELDITPMIDIVFLLLAFFVVSSKMSQPTPLKLPLAKNGKGIITEESIVLSVKASGDDVIVKGGKQAEKSFNSTGEALLLEIEEYVKTELEANRERIKNVVLKCEATVKNGQVGPIFVAARKGAPEEIKIFTATEEKK